MKKGEPFREKLLLTLALGTAGIITASLLMLFLSPHKAPTGTQVILFGSGLWLWGLLLGWLLGPTGVRSPTGPTSNSQEVSPSRQMMQQGPCSPEEAYQMSGKPPSPSRPST